ncbi:efflux transporter outer membrane subunit [Xanthobacter agilis]|uniref:NodT family efflux transporter outer membrane factor (OMF) lipoprotein n=1 Tax=Xanthobacter agilis TaxID=47492 RepID=A0ABU0L8U7_XANAG|nr:NodT family efflux transporter outer membrane factor (OMF) lipoprotein [Xanthobacter agilis]
MSCSIPLPPVPRGAPRAAPRHRFGAIARSGALVLAVLLAGCSVGPDYATPAFDLPARWSDQTGRKKEPAPPQLAHWWERLKDPTLNTLIATAVDGNLDVATAKAKIREARATYRQQVGGLFPQVDFSGTATRGQNGSRVGSGGDITVGGLYTDYQAGFDASWELDLFGANRRGVEAAAYGTQSAEDELRATLLTLVGDVASNYVAARGYQARIALAERTAASQRETAALTRTKLEAGAVSAVDVANATGLAASTEANIPGLKAQLAQSIHRLGVLTGQPPSTLAGRILRGGPIPSPRAPVSKGVPADVLRNRPDVRQAERTLAQSTALIGQAEAARYPAVSLTGNINTDGTKVGDLVRGSAISWSYGPTLSVPVFTGGQLKAAVEVADAQRDQTFLAYHASILTALEDVENAAVALNQERAKAGKLAQSAAAYRDATRLARALYQNGSTSFLEVLDAERSLYSAEDSLLVSQAAIATDYVALNKALGGGWDGAMDVTTPAVVDTNTGPHFSQMQP